MSAGVLRPNWAQRKFAFVLTKNTSAGNPESRLLRALSDAAPQLATAIPMVISAVGAIIAALSQPPRIGRK